MSLAASSFPVEEKIFGTDDAGRPSPGKKNRRLKKLEKTASVLSKILKPDEKILLATDAIGPLGLFEQYVTGTMVFWLYRSILIFTDRRLVQFYLSGPLKRSIRSIPYESIRRVEKYPGAISRRLTLAYSNGKKETFHYVAERKEKLRPVLEPPEKAPVPKEIAGARGMAGGPVSLCPACSGGLTAEIYRCGTCGAQFKNLSALTRWATICPGGGFFYAGYTLLGVPHALAEAIFTIFAGIALVGGDFPDAGIMAGLVALLKVFGYYTCGQSVRKFIPLSRI